MVFGEEEGIGLEVDEQKVLVWEWEKGRKDSEVEDECDSTLYAMQR